MDAIPGTVHSLRRRPIKAVACHRCHGKKIKCSGGHPCRNCVQAEKGNVCAYPQRNRSVKVSQKYIDGLLEEINRLKQSQTARAHVETAAETQPDAPTGQRPPNITFNRAPWFDNRNVFQTPVLISEAVDAAFATRFRQVISDPNAPEPTHLLRVNYANNDALMALKDSPVAWPSLSRARFLIEAATRYINRKYYIFHQDSVIEGLSSCLLDQPLRESVIHCKYWVLFAIGELCAMRTSVTHSYPGMIYFAHASKMLGHLDERPGTDSIETYSAYILSGTAMRSAIVMGLHLNISESQLADAAAREHRRKLFWTVYMFDRMWGANLGLPAAIQDDEIEVDLPSPTDGSQYSYHLANIELTRHLTSVVRSVYKRPRNHDIYLATRVQGSLQDLQSWVDRLPSHLQIDTSVEKTHDPNVVSLHLSFYQCVIVATRPILLHSLRMQVAATQSTTSSTASKVPESAAALSEACIRCARNSFHLLTRSWIDGTFVTFDCFFTQYLFSSMTILAISSVLSRKDAHTDRDSFNEASRLLEELGAAGNCVAQEYCHHVEAIQASLSDHAKATAGPAFPDMATMSVASQSQLSQGLSADVVSPANIPWTNSSLQMLLSQPPLDIQFLEDAVGDRYPQGLYRPESGYET
ncbi:fungal-specific transcription factor [Xylaria arbuscula]|nr:fungal-specific transcription factor [Xylaria arbuscula]